MSTDLIPGIHHITAIASDPQRTVDFYEQVMGLRLVKLTVNFDDPGTYHLYFGDETGSPGTILTFFPWPHVPPGSTGSGQVTAVAFETPIHSLDFWLTRLRERGVSTGVEERFDDPVVRLRDPDGLWLELVGVSRSEERRGHVSSAVPPEHALRRFHSATLCEHDETGSGRLLDMMGFAEVNEQAGRIRYRAAGSSASLIDIVREPRTPLGELGAGIVHHIAFRTPTDDEQARWRQRLTDHGYRVTPIINRVYFHSIYFREPGGVLFEIATDPPGFAVDEPLEHLGERLMLPTWLEASRAELEHRLPPLTHPARSGAR